MKIINIDWDTESDGEIVDADLPTTITIEDEEIDKANISEEDIADWLSDKYGWCVKSFQIYKFTSERAIELINSFVDHISAGEDTATTIKYLLWLGFNKDELVHTFNFTESDVTDAEQNMDDFDGSFILT